jgi:hypothetical protein
MPSPLLSVYTDAEASTQQDPEERGGKEEKNGIGTKKHKCHSLTDKEEKVKTFLKSLPW